MTNDDHDDLEAVSDEERREAEALARALDGGSMDDAPGDALGAAAFLRGVADAKSLDAHARKVEGEVFGAREAPVTRPRTAVRAIAFTTTLLASAAALMLFVRMASPSMRPASAPAEAAPTAAAAESVVTASPVVAAPVADVASTDPTSDGALDAERRFLEASPTTQDAAFLAMRSAWSGRRDAQLAAMIARHGGVP